VRKDLLERKEHAEKRVRKECREHVTRRDPPRLAVDQNVVPLDALGFTSLRRFKIYQPEELKMSNILPLMEACFSLLPTIMAIFINTRQAP